MLGPMYSTYPPLDAPEVEVLRDGTWWPGFLEHWRKDGDRWTGDVRYTVGVGQTYVAWVDQNRIRQTARLSTDST